MHIAIIGPGLIGHSVALAAQRGNPSHHITEIDRGASIEPARGADIIVLTAPVDAILAIIREHADLLRGSVTIDTGSTKRAVVTAARAAGLSTFIGGHPMAGGTSSGPAAARADLFDARPWFLVPHGAEPTAVAAAQSFVTELGAYPVLMSDDGAEHDRVLAAISHLPQVVASALMVLVADAAGPHLKWAGNGLRDTTRLADSSGVVWQSVLDTNADELRPLLLRVAAALEQLALELGNGRAVGDLFDRAQRARELL